MDVTDAQRRNGEEVENPKTCFVAQALVDREQFHAGTISIWRYKARAITQFLVSGKSTKGTPFPRRNADGHQCVLMKIRL